MTTVSLTDNEVAAIVVATLKILMGTDAPAFVVQGMNSVVDKLQEAFDA